MKDLPATNTHPLKVRRIQRHTHQNPTNKPSRRQGQHPPNEDLANLLPIQTLEVAVGQSDTDDGTSDTLRRGYWKTHIRIKQHSDSGRELHRVAARGRVLGDLVAEVAHDVCDGERMSVLDEIGW